LPIVVTEAFESVAVGAARQAAWALTGELPDWPVPVITRYEPSESDVRAAQEISDRYRQVLTDHAGWKGISVGPEISSRQTSAEERRM
jgi:xylulokinase